MGDERSPEQPPDEIGQVVKVAGVARSEREPERAGEYKLPSALVLHTALRTDGEEQLSRPAPSLVWSEGRAPGRREVPA